MSPTPLHGKKQDGRGQHNVVPIQDFRKQAVLTWLCTPLKERDPSTQTALAEQLGITRQTIGAWKENKEFMDAWEKRYLQTIGDPSRKSEIMDTLFATATDKDDPKHVAAARQYFDIEGSVKPAKVQVEVMGSATQLTDEQLELLIAQKAATEIQHRKKA
ncbi:hypothetical protein [Ilumatobacter sp.]|uniref:hypothetical protein n=1 Tax=Ilumatobacter sp. TaxID=1967498 RepID=UPI00375183C0